MKDGAILALNAGSSNLKCALFELRADGPVRLASTRIDTVGEAVDAKAVLGWAEATGWFTAAASCTSRRA